MSLLPLTAEFEFTLKPAMASIQTCQNVLTTQIDLVKMDLSLMRHDMHTICTRVTAAEQRNSDVVKADHSAKLNNLKSFAVK